MGMMINRRRAYGGKKLPYDYEVEWIGTDGNVEFKTNYIPNTLDLTFEGKFYFIGYVDNTTYVRWWGAYTGNPPAYRIIRKMSTNNQVLPYNGEGGNSASVTLVVSINTTYTFKFTPSQYIWNGVSNYNPQRGIGTATGKFYIFHNNFKGRMIGHFKVTKGNDIVAEFIPVVKNGVGCIYDAVSDELYYNISTGTPTVGPTILS